MKKDVIIIAGPTGSGKSSLAIELYNKLPCEIISADSMQIYKNMDIGTAKVTKEIQDKVIHHMIDIINPNESYSVMEYQVKVLNIIDDIISRGKTPIIVGGTGLYINSIYYEYDFNDVKPDLKFRKELELSFEDKAQSYLDDLLSIDENKYKNLTVRDKKKIIRALEVYKKTGKTITVDSSRNLKYNFHLYVLTDERTSLYENINKRVDNMLEAGLIEEVRSLVKQYDLNENSQSMKAIGYREVIPYINNQMDYDTMVEKLKQDTRRYAKRQLTWFRKIEDAIWLDKSLLSKEDMVLKIIGDIN